MGRARKVYELVIGRAGRPSLVALFDPAPSDEVGTVSKQDAYFRRWLDGRKNRD